MKAFCVDFDKQQPKDDCPICEGLGEVRVSDTDWGTCRRCHGTGKDYPSIYQMLQAENYTLRERLKETREAYEEYIKLLAEEINSLLGLAHVHGWHSNIVEKGKECREKIATLNTEI